MFKMNVLNRNVLKKVVAIQPFCVFVRLHCSIIKNELFKVANAAKFSIFVINKGYCIANTMLHK